MHQYPKFAIILHEGEHELIEAVSDECSREFRVLYFLHLEDVCAFRVFQVLSDLCFIVELKLLQTTPQLLLQLVGQWWKIFIIHDCAGVQLHNDALSVGRCTSGSMVWSTIAGEIPTMRGTGAVMYSLRGAGRIGMRTCSQRKGKAKERKASMAKPRIVRDCDTKMIFFYKRIASNTLMMA